MYRLDESTHVLACTPEHDRQCRGGYIAIANRFRSAENRMCDAKPGAKTLTARQVAQLQRAYLLETGGWS